MGAWLCQVREMVRPLSCSPEVLGKSYLKADLSVECGTPDHRAHVLLAVFVLLVFCAGLPLGAIGVMAWKRRRGKGRKTPPDAVTRALSFMSVDYRKKRCGGSTRGDCGAVSDAQRLAAGSIGRACCS